MSATAEAPSRLQLTRDQAAERLRELLTDEPQSGAALRRELLGEDAARSKAGRSDVAIAGLRVLESRRAATFIKGRGWVRYAPTEAELPPPEDVDFESAEWGLLSIHDLFIDESYQRPVTSLVAKIRRNFSKRLFNFLIVNDRGSRHKPHRYAVVDGQTRWRAAMDLNLDKVPCLIHRGLTVEQEAELFALLQTERRGMVSWHRFRAALRAGNPEATAILRLVKDAGFEIGDQKGQIKAVAALESCFRKKNDGPFLLERTLVTYKAAWPDVVPEDVFIKGLHRFYREYPMGDRRRRRNQPKPQVEGARLVTRLKTSGPRDLRKRMDAIKEGGASGRGTNDYYMALAIQGMYLSGNR